MAACTCDDENAEPCRCRRAANARAVIPDYLSSTLSSLLRVVPNVLAGADPKDSPYLRKICRFYFLNDQRSRSVLTPARMPLSNPSKATKKVRLRIPDTAGP